MGKGVKRDSNYAQTGPEGLGEARKKHLGKDDIQTFPMRAITGVGHDRNTLGTDEVKVTFG